MKDNGPRMSLMDGELITLTLTLLCGANMKGNLEEDKCKVEGNFFLPMG